MRFCKDILGVQRETCNIGVLLELGRVPLMLFGKKNCIKNWVRIGNQGKANKTVLISYLNCTEEQLKWPTCVMDCLNRIGIGVGNINELVDKIALQRMIDIFYQEAFADISRENSKLRTYAKLKQNRGLENYLKNVNVEERTPLTKIRLSNHDLMIEKGRHQGLEVHQRNCPLCTEIIVEDELHFLLQCKTYSSIRAEMFTHAKIHFLEFDHFSKDQQLKTLLTDDNLVKHSGNYLLKAFELRRFLLGKHKNAF